MEKCLVFDSENVYTKTRTDREDNLKEMRKQVYSLCDIYHLIHKNKRLEMTAEWTYNVIMVPVHELAPVSKGIAMQKMYALMYDIATNHRDGLCIARDAPRVYADRRNVSRWSGFSKEPSSQRDRGDPC